MPRKLNLIEISPSKIKYVSPFDENNTIDYTSSWFSNNGMKVAANEHQNSSSNIIIRDPLHRTDINHHVFQQVNGVRTLMPRSLSTIDYPTKPKDWIINSMMRPPEIVLTNVLSWHGSVPPDNDDDYYCYPSINNNDDNNNTTVENGSNFDTNKIFQLKLPHATATNQSASRKGSEPLIDYTIQHYYSQDVGDDVCRFTLRKYSSSLTDIMGCVLKNVIPRRRPNSKARGMAKTASATATSTAKGGGNGIFKSSAAIVLRSIFLTHSQSCYDHFTTEEDDECYCSNSSPYNQSMQYNSNPYPVHNYPPNSSSTTLHPCPESSIRYSHEKSVLPNLQIFKINDSWFAVNDSVLALYRQFQQIGYLKSVQAQIIPKHMIPKYLIERICANNNPQKGGYNNNNISIPLSTPNTLGWLHCNTVPKSFSGTFNLLKEIFLTKKQPTLFNEKDSNNGEKRLVKEETQQEDGVKVSEEEYCFDSLSDNNDEDSGSIEDGNLGSDDSTDQSYTTDEEDGDSETDCEINTNNNSSSTAVSDLESVNSSRRPRRHDNIPKTDT